MLRSQRLLFVAGAVLPFVVLACGSDAETPGTTPPPDGTLVGQPPPRPEENKPGDGPGVVLAISKLYLGDTDRNGMKSASAWKGFGFNLDGQVSTAESTNLCAPRAGGKKVNVYPDGNTGIDNSFGKNILPILTGVAPDASTQVNEQILEGAFTIMISLEKLGTADTYNPLSAGLYGGADLGAAPKFDGTDEWPLLPELLDTSGNPKIKFANGYLTKNTWVSGDKGKIDLTIGIGGFNLTIGIGAALVAMDLDANHKSAGNGTIAGVIDTEQFITELKKVAGAFSEDLCEGSTIESIANQLRQASDIMKDGTAGSPSQECDGISIGLGFDAKEVLLGAVAEPAEPPADPCAMGTGGAGGAGTGGMGGSAN
jgi:hypothetical protein